LHFQLPSTGRRELQRHTSSNSSTTTANATTDSTSMAPALADMQAYLKFLKQKVAMEEAAAFTDTGGSSDHALSE
jgi:hypothetical protein